MKKKIAVIFGGKSTEHDVSIITAHAPIIDSLTILGDYDIYPIYISKNGVWYCDTQFLSMDFFKKPDYENFLTNKMKIILDISDGFTIIGNSFLTSKKTKIDLVFPSMHGTFGEDGSLMGLLRMADIPYVGCDIFASTVAMDKALTKQILSSQKIPITNVVVS